MSRLTEGLVSQIEFSDENLIATSRAFLSSQSGDHKLGILLIAHEPESLYQYGVIDLPEGLLGRYENPRTVTMGRAGGYDIAECFSFDGSAILLIKRGASFRKIQIKGERDPRLQSAPGITARLVSLAVRDPTINAIEVFARATTLPSETEANALCLHISSILGLDHHLTLTLRVDSNFRLEGGPVAEVLDSTADDLTEAAYYSREYVACLPNWASATEPRSVCRTVLPTRRTGYTTEKFLYERGRGRRGQPHSTP